MPRSNWINSITPIQLEIASQLLLQCRLCRLQHIIKHSKTGWVLLIVALALIHARPHQTRIPPIHVSTDDIRLWVVANHVDVLGKPFLVMDCVHPGGHHLVGVFIGCEFRLAVDDSLEFDAGDRLVPIRVRTSDYRQYRR